MKIVVIDWVDSIRAFDWTLVDDVDENSLNCISVGFLFKETNNHVTIAQNFGLNPEQVCNLITIPKCSIKNIREMDELLEKQGEKKPHVQRGECLDCQFNYAGECKGSCAMKRNEQKPVDKVEPKFKVGDWVTNGVSTYQVYDIRDNEYWLSAGEIAGKVDISDYHLWTIQDAKDGDVLTANKSIFIFKQEYAARKPEAYCGIINGEFIDNAEGCFTNEICYPATKEQRDTLFTKMKEAGYEFDFEKKELKKIHVIDEGKAEMDYCFTKMMNGEKVNPAWSEEDDYNLQCMIAKVTSDIQKGNVGRNNELIDWLKSLKERIGG